MLKCAIRTAKNYTAQYCTGICPVYVTTDTDKVKQYQYTCVKNYLAMFYDTT